MARKFLKRILPDQATVAQSKVLQAMGPWLLHPSVWTLHRKSVAGGVAAGLFCGLFPAPFQMAGAALASVLFHWNLPVAVFTTLYTNPVTFLPLYLIALKIGIWILNAVLPPKMLDGQIQESAFPGPPEFDWSSPWSSFVALGDWGLGMGWPLFVGVLTLATLLAITGYIAVRSAWSLWIRYELIRRRRRRKA